MLLSMTGFGEAHHQEAGLLVSVEVRTINNKHLKVSVRCGEAYASLDSKIEAIVRNRVRRGTVQVQVRLTRVDPGDAYRINREVLEGYRRQLSDISRTWHLSDTVPVSALLALPGVIDEGASGGGDVESVWPVVSAAVGEALDGLAIMRQQEGSALADDLRDNCATIAKHLKHIEARLPILRDEYQVRLLERVNKTLEKFDVTVAAADVVREIGLLAERADVSEEIVRLRSHLEQFESFLQSEESVGRKLDFLSQEMYREANTIGSKASDVEIPKHVIEVKTSVERIREQVQNVE